MEDNMKVKVRNRSGNGNVGYTIPDLGNLERVFEDGEEKTVTFEQIRKLSYSHGGRVLLKEYLVVEDKEALKELGLVTEPEYFYTKEDVIKIMKTGTLDEFLDCLDFAPEGIKESIKTLAVELPLNDVAKRQAIEEKLGFNVTNAIENKRITEEETEDFSVKPVSQRRAAAPSGKETGSKTESTGARRVAVKEEK